MDQVVKIVQELWTSVVGWLGGPSTTIAAINLLGLILMLLVILVKDVQDTFIRVAGWLLEFMLLDLPSRIWPRLRSPEWPTHRLHGPQAMHDDLHEILLILGAYSLVCTLIVALAVTSR